GLFPLGSGVTTAEEVIAIVTEITDEKKNRQHSEYKNRLINQLTSINNGPLLHVIEDDPPLFKFISGNISSLTSYSDEEMSRRNWLDIIHEDDRENALVNLKELKSRSQLSRKDLVYRIRSRDGDIKWINNHISKTDAETEEVLIGVIFNVTEIHLLHDKLK